MTVSNTAPSSQSDSAPRSSRRVPLRLQLLALTLAPLLALGATWLTVTVTAGAADDRALLVQGARQTASILAQGVFQDLSRTNRAATRINPLDAALITGIQSRLSEIVQQDLLPLEFVVVVNDRRVPVAVFDRVFLEPGAPADVALDAVGAWRRVRPEAGALVVVESTAPATRTSRLDGRAVTLVEEPLPAGAGGVVMGLREDRLRARVETTVLGTIALLGTVFLLAALIAALFAGALTRRVLSLLHATDAISLGRLDAPIQSARHDELGDLAAAIERLRTSLEILLARGDRQT
jgi:HAMP domain-containing protein